MATQRKVDPESPSSDRTLRIITILTFEPAFALLVAHAVMRHRAFPAVGLVSMAVSALFGLFLVVKPVKQKSAIYVVDALLASTLITFLILGWIEIAHERGVTAIIASYGTMPLMINFCIHLSFVIRKPLSSVVDKMSRKLSKPFRCPHCHAQLQSNWRKATRQGSVHSHDSEDGYRDEPSDNIVEDAQSIVASSSMKTRQDAAPLLVRTENDDDGD